MQINFQEIYSSTVVINPAELFPLIAGKTEKPFGIDPTRLLSRGPKEGREFRIGFVPLDQFSPNELSDLYDGTVSIKIAKDYASRPAIETAPIIALQGRKGGLLRVLDGGHRISAARMRGDASIYCVVEIETQKLSEELCIKEVSANYFADIHTHRQRF